MVKKKGKSKRMTFKQKYKIERKVRDHKKKTKKDTRRRAKLGLPPVGIGKKKNIEAIPNSWPFKAELLEQVAAAKQRAEEEKVQKKLEAAERRKKGLAGGDVSKMVEEAKARAAEFEQKEGSKADKETDDVKDMQRLGQQSRRAYIRDLREVIEQADVILEVLDARDPLGSRAEAVEEIIMRKPDKKIVFVLNKVDLVPKQVVADWLAYLRRFHPTIAFKAATQEQKSGLSQSKGDAAKASASLLRGSGSVGADSLLQLLKNYCRSLDIKTAITVGIVGYPNVGKSSLINSLKRSKSVGVSPTPGFTKAMQEVQLDKHIKLLDSPGIVFDDDDVEGVLLRNCVNVDTLADPVAAAHAVLSRCTPQDLMMIYALPRFDGNDVMGFLALLAKKKGKLIKGGTPNRNAAARIVLHDWNTGKVPFYTLPPVDTGEEVVGSEGKIVSALGDQFDVMQAADAKVLEYLGDEDDREFVACVSGSSASKGRRMAEAMLGSDDEMMVEGEEDEEDEEEEEEESGEEMEEEEEEEEEEGPAPVQAKGRVTRAQQARHVVDVDAARRRKGASSGAKAATQKKRSADAMDEDHINPQVNQVAKKQWKADKKKERKVQQRKATSSGGAYDFATDFYDAK